MVLEVQNVTNDGFFLDFESILNLTGYQMLETIFKECKTQKHDHFEKS